MSLNTTPEANRVHIGIFGRRNAGKSSLINALTGQPLAIVSAVPGTTADPVSKAMELLPLGPVVFVDTAGLDDEGELGAERVHKSLQKLESVDIALLVTDASQPDGPTEADILRRIKELSIPHLVVRNKADLCESTPNPPPEGEIWVSAATGQGIEALKERIARLKPQTPPEKPLVADLLAPGEVVVLVTPIDASAPKGRLILPQQQTIRDILEAGAGCFVTQPTGLPGALAALKNPPRLVVTDSQAFARVAADVPPEIPLTSFSILFARHKGALAQTVAGLSALDTLAEGDPVLISEGCTHHRQCEDIGTVKIPRWLAEHIGKNKKLDFTFSSGGGFPEDLTPFKLVVHCGGCTLTPLVMQRRLARAAAQGVPMTNYGMLIAQMQGILQRSLAPFPEFAGAPAKK